MIDFLADENFDNTILRGVQRKLPEFLYAYKTQSMYHLPLR